MSAANILSLGSSKSENDTIPADITSTFPAALRYIFISFEILVTVIGLLANLFLIVLSFRKISLQNEQRWLILNLSVIYMAFCIVYLFDFAGELITLPDNVVDFRCQTQVFVAYYLFAASVTALHLVTLSRQYALSNTRLHEKFFQGKFVFVILVVSHLISVSFSVFLICFSKPFPSTAGETKSNMELCVPMFRGAEGSISEYAFYIGSVAYLVCMNLYLLATVRSCFVLYSLVKHHLRIVESLNHRGRLTELHDLAKSALWQVICPLICHVPYFVTAWIGTYELVFLKHKELPSAVSYFSLFSATLMTISPLIMSVITIVIVKPYRLAWLRLFRQMRKSNKIDTQNLTIHYAAPRYAVPHSNHPT